MTCSPRRFARARRALILACLIAILAGCTGLGGEPPIVATLIPPSPAPPTPTEPIAPPARPDLTRGAAVFAANCTRCHGARGDGDGEFARSGQVVIPNHLSDPQTGFRQTPADYFNTITNGRIANLMPPWRDALSLNDRWSVALYAYTLPHTAEQIARGRELYQAACAECHGETGRGDGVRARELRDHPGDLSDAAGMAFISDSAIYTSINEGIGDVMPAQGQAYGGDWTDDDIRAVTAFVRTLALANADPGAVQQVAATPEVTDEAIVGAPPAAVRVTGRVRNATATGMLPDALPLTLFIIQPGTPPRQRTIDGRAAADGAFSFDAVDYDPQSVFIVAARYRDRDFASVVLRGADLEADAADGVLDLSFSIYELTDDPAVIAIAGMVTQLSVVGDSIEVAQVFNIRNTSDRAFTSADTTADGRPIGLVIPLPPGALIASVRGAENRYAIPPDNSALIDTAMVLPGEGHLINVIYLIPYDGDAGAIIEQPINYALDGVARLLVRPVDLAVRGEQFPSIGLEQIGAAQFAAYGGQLTLPARSVLRYELSGRAAEAAAVDRGTGAVVSSNLLPLVAAIVLIAALGIGAAVYIISARMRPAADPTGLDAQIDALAGAIAQLDTDYAAGGIDAESYQVQRAALRARLARLVAQRDEGRA
jgi:mono/diheme cytochrome c family protein